MQARIPWSRLTAESVVIVLSILLAFGIDAWWSGREERAKEEAALAGIARDFEQHRQILVINLERYERRLEAAEELLGLLGPRAERGDSTLATVIGTLGVAGPVRFQGGTLETITETDGLALLRDSQLQADLARWRQGLDDLEGINEFVSTEARSMLEYLRTRQSLQELDRLAGWAALPPSAFAPDLLPVLRDLEFSNIVYQQHYATSVLLSYLRRLAAVADSVLVRVR